MQTGIFHHLKAQVKEPIAYSLSLGDCDVLLNPVIGRILTLTISHDSQCVGCGQVIQKSYQQGFCFPCTQTLARCDLCFVRPERCHYHLGTCREPTWAQKHCMSPHIVYLAVTSTVKVGITRESKCPTRWLDQGASQALAIARTHTRYQAGLLEVELAKYVVDKTNWRKMLAGVGDKVDLAEQRDALIARCKMDAVEFTWLGDVSQQFFQYPILQYPKKVQSIKLDADISLTAKLLGIKGQYLLFEQGVLNMRQLAGRHLQLSYI